MTDGDQQFNLVRAAFWLAAACIAVELLIVLLGAGWCLMYSDMIVQGHYTCDAKDKLTDLLDKATSASMGFLAGVLAGNTKRG